MSGTVAASTSYWGTKARATAPPAEQGDRADAGEGGAEADDQVGDLPGLIGGEQGAAQGLAHEGGLAQAESWSASPRGWSCLRRRWRRRRPRPGCRVLPPVASLMWVSIMSEKALAWLE